MPMRPAFFAHRPPWWPENEAWPPARGRMRHNPFFRRMGCVFAVFNLFGFVVFIMVAAWIASLLGLAHLPANVLSWLPPLGIGVLIFVLAVVGLGMFGLRRIFVPLDDLLDAAGRVAQGDYSTRVAEKGTPEVRSLARAFNNMASRLHDTDEKRRNLLADVTHELRTPLTVIRGNLEGMLDGVYPADEVNLRSLLDETDLLARLVEDLRVLALAESGALQLRKETCDFSGLARETLAVFQSQAQAAGVELVLEAAQDLPWLEIDPGRMRQVLSNLVSNALRYSPPGGTILVRCAVVASNFILEVSDDGPGIPAADLPYIFERFYKSTNSVGKTSHDSGGKVPLDSGGKVPLDSGGKTPLDSGGKVPLDSGGKVPLDSGGMGLGLAIARHLVTAHGGRIEAQSTPGHGTTIRISLGIETTP